jgi:hypothetical protein
VLDSGRTSGCARMDVRSARPHDRFDPNADALRTIALARRSTTPTPDWSAFQPTIASDPRASAPIADRTARVAACRIGPMRRQLRRRVQPRPPRCRRRPGRRSDCLTPQQSRQDCPDGDFAEASCRTQTAQGRASRPGCPINAPRTYGRVGLAVPVGLDPVFAVASMPVSTHCANSGEREPLVDR